MTDLGSGIGLRRDGLTESHSLLQIVLTNLLNLRVWLKACSERASERDRAGEKGKGKREGGSKGSGMEV